MGRDELQYIFTIACFLAARAAPGSPGVWACYTRSAFVVPPFLTETDSAANRPLETQGITWKENFECFGCEVRFVSPEARSFHDRDRRFHETD